MSAEITLSSPVLISTFQIEEILNRLESVEAENQELRAEIKTLKENIPSVAENVLRENFDSMLATSDMEVLKRLQAVEKVTGNYVFEEWEEHEPTISERLNALELRPIVPAETEIEKPVIPSKNITEIRADFLIDYITNKTHLIPKVDSPFANVRAWVVNSKEFRYFIENELPGEYLPEPLKAHKQHWDGWRKLKSDVFEAVEKRFKQTIKGKTEKGMFIDQADHGRKELRLIYTKQLDAQEEEELLTRMGMISAPSLTVTA